MKTVKNAIFNSAKTLALTSLLILSNSAVASNPNSVIDDFSNEHKTNAGIERVLINDTSAGGQTTSNLAVSSGVVQLKGEITPPRGQPGWSSLVLPFSATGEIQDASQFSGIRLLVKINHGNISISANSSQVTNFDYHAAPIVVSQYGKFHEIKVPFDSMKRAWSEQTKLNTQTLNSLSIVAYGMQKTSYDFEIDEVSFY